MGTHLTQAGGLVPEASRTVPRNRVRRRVRAQASLEVPLTAWPFRYRRRSGLH